jgi:hypothetical protein
MSIPQGYLGDKKPYPLSQGYNCSRQSRTVSLYELRSTVKTCANDEDLLTSLTP